MSLEQAILDRLEKRNAQIAQLQSTVHALERAADSQREHARQEQERLRDARQRLDDLKLELREEAGKRWNATEERDALVRENTKLGARIERMEESAASAELLRKSLNAEITKRDHELRAHEKELAEQRLEREQMQHQIGELRTECDRIREISKSLVPKSALKQAVQEAAELHSEVARLRAEVPLESTREGLKNAVAKLQEVNAQLDSAKGEAEEWLKQCHAARRQRDEVKAEARKETQRLSDLCAELQSKYESILTKTTDLGSYAMTLGRKEGEPLEMFMERQALRLAALESEAGKIGYVAKGEHEEAVTAARENGIHKGESLSGFIWRQCAGLRKSQAENAPLSKLFVVLCKQRGNLNEEIIYRAVDEASEEINKLTA